MAETTMQTVNGARPATTEEPRGVTVNPRVDILETDDELLVYLDLPGVKPDDVDVRFESGELTILGRRLPARPEKTTATGWEYDSIGYNRTFRVTEQIAADRIAAELKNGVLTLRLPKVEAVKPRRIAVTG